MSFLHHVSVVVPKPAFGRAAQIEEAEQDAAKLATYLQAQAAAQGLTYERVDVSARDAVLQAVDAAAVKLNDTGTTAGHLLVVSFLCHGVRCPADNADAGALLDFLLCSDRALSDVDLRKALTGIRLKNGTLVVLLDACYGGGALTSEELPAISGALAVTADITAPRRREGFYPSSAKPPGGKEPKFQTEMIQMAPSLGKVLPGFTRAIVAFGEANPGATYAELDAHLRSDAKFKSSRVSSETEAVRKPSQHGSRGPKRAPLARRIFQV